MVAPLTGKLAAVLEDRRGGFNAEFMEARRQYRRLEPQFFLDFLRDVVAPIVELAELPLPVALALYDLGLHVLGSDLTRVATPLWRQVLPPIISLVERDPQRVVASLTNAAINLSRTAGARGGEWQTLLAETGPHCLDVATLLAVGQVAAWRCGLAQYRMGALQAAAQLPEGLCQALLGLPPTEVRVWASDPWRPTHPGAAARQFQIVNRVGGFRGFGGPFLRPPVLQASGDSLFVTDGEDSWLISADLFGAVLTRTPLPLTSTVGALTLSDTGEVRCGELAQRLPRLATPTSWASNQTTLAVAVPRSHWVYLVAARSA